MSEKELVRRLVLNEISDDYENVDQTILPSVSKFCSKLGFLAERSDIVEALSGLIDEGLAKAYHLSQGPAEEVQGMPPLDVIEDYFETYFYITPKGVLLQTSDRSWWPFDEEGNTRP